jgi:glycine hydroxymethyltransferase
MLEGNWIEVVAGADETLAQLMRDEEARQIEGIELIASENFQSPAVRFAQASAMQSKYAEGLPGKRYYGGCSVVDAAENLARDRAKELFGVPYASVQAHSGAQANMAVFLGLLEHGDTVLGMDLSHGGHLTHGHPLNFSGLEYDCHGYQVDAETEQIDYEKLAELAAEKMPKLIIAGASAYPRSIDFARFREIADSVDAYLMVDMAHIAGLVATGLHPNPWPHAHVVTTTTHKTLRGPRGGLILTDEELGPKLDKALFPGIQGGPMMHTIAAKAVAFHEALQPSFKAYQERVVANAARLIEKMVEGGLRAISGGTDNHLGLLDTDQKGMSGKKAERLLGLAGITVNKNTIPFDKRKPFITSGIRVGSPAITTRGMGLEDMDRVAGWVVRSLDVGDEPEEQARIEAEVKEFASAFPLFEA